MAFDLVFSAETTVGSSTAIGGWFTSYGSANFVANHNPNSYSYNATSALLTLPSGNYIFETEGWMACSASTFTQLNAGLKVGASSYLFAGGEMGGSNTIRISGKKSFSLGASTNVVPAHQSFTVASGSTIQIVRWEFWIYKYS
eukprot:GHVU01112090.1.p1 GENE.GHVU01112090.1~~GHVU01112090.1.p1  ORF type:complete len:143 (-),score=9.23 GHVU01112090.1:358-786(-)